MIKFCALLLAVCLLQGLQAESPMRIKVWAPKGLTELFPKGIEYNIGNYGRVPYGKSLVGSIHVADPFDGCQQLTPIVVPKEGENNKKASVAPFVLVERGGCDFVTKTHYAEIAGAKLVIVINDDLRKPSEINMGDDGYGSTLGIPSIIISMDDGRKLVDYITRTDERPKTSLSVKFELPKASRVEYMFWMSSSDATSYNFINRFHKFHTIFEDNIEIKPHYVIWHCYHCSQEKYKNTENPNCISGGRYCSPDPDNEGPASGKNVVIENIRQLCIFKLYRDLWWDYMREFGSTCIPKMEEECASRSLKKVGIPETSIGSCVRDSFEGEFLKSKNTLLDHQRWHFKDLNVPFWPAIIINNVTYRGNIEDPEEVFDAICAAFTEKPEICDLYYNPSRSSPFHYVFVILIVVGVLVAFLYFMVIIYKRKIRNELTYQMESQIATTVSQYVSMTDLRKPNESSL
eukprot:TRINITY_DN10686_c0_g1_i1.p1 TRINITY_DN10686_c0_g1~~TRINITY_DN10686_c0_g1_i1.p1  ORF type:complete len:460 (-),score=98.88 TRINITY_DN10686_c0_g1_i1:140-1519(-)